MSRLMRCMAVICVVALGTNTLLAAEKKAEEEAPAAAAAEAAEAAPAKVKFGGDIRIREEYLDSIPAGPPGQNDYFRFRTRIYTRIDPVEDLSLMVRVANECRHYEKPENDAWNAMDEFVVDQLYLDLKNVFDGAVDLRLGRQDLMYGSGKLILEGTPEDGSRTIYSDAVKLTFKSMEKTTVDLFGIYNQPENDLVLHGEDRDLTGLTGGYDDMVESGGGVYLKDKSIERMPLEAYYIFKQEEDWTQNAVADTNSPTGYRSASYPAWAELDPDACVYNYDALDLSTVGFRLTPKLSDQLSGNLEVAYQFGDRGDMDVEAYGLDAAITFCPSFAKDMKGSVALGYYYLSGDDPTTADKDEGWNPLWARYPQSSELYVFSYPRGRWSNLEMPHLDLSITPIENVTAKATLAYLGAVENDGPGDGDERGVLTTAKLEFTLAEKVFTQMDKLSGHLQAEMLEIGDYYEDSPKDTAYFLRWQLAYEF